MSKSKASMRDVARVADVSLSTVWMVVNDKPGISPKTVARVRDVIVDLGYVVKTSRQSTAEQGQPIGLLIEVNSMPVNSDIFYGDIFYGDVIRGFQAEADELGYQVLLSVYERRNRNLTPDPSWFLAQISGLAIANYGEISPETIKSFLSPDLPVVLIESYLDNYKVACVLGDNYSAGYEIARHILELGHRRIAVLRGPTQFSSLVDRLRGCLAALAEQDLGVPEKWMPAPIEVRPFKGYMQMKDILACGDLPTAVIAMNDRTAFTAMEAIREYGLQIPQDISIASIDNTQESGFARPPLTTVNIPQNEIGALGLRKLHDIIEGRSKLPYKTVVYSELVVRESTRRIDS